MPLRAVREETWIQQALPDHAALFMEGGPLDELMWLYQVAINTGYCHLIEGVIKPSLNLTTAPETRRYFLARYDQIVTILEAAEVPFARLPELNLTAKAHGHRPPCDCTQRGFYQFEAHVRIELHHSL